WEQGRKLRDGYNVLAREYGLSALTGCLGPAPRTVISFKDKTGEDDLLLKSLFQQECIKRGVLFSGGHNMSFSHTGRDIDYTLSVYKTALGVIKKGIDRGNASGLLEGRPISPVFRKP
ncbi:MAG: aspartate aminotransferase family protein, partial [Candidatus Omnitrophica bacterium]|nr:aspartate aminotransferase family protein [Candidatus Omnitrophota bacterium]